MGLLFFRLEAVSPLQVRKDGVFGNRSNWGQGLLAGKFSPSGGLSRCKLRLVPVRGMSSRNLQSLSLLRRPEFTGDLRDPHWLSVAIPPGLFS